MIASAVAFTKFLVNDLESALFALFQVASNGCIVYIILVGFIKRAEIADLFTTIQAIEKECEIDLQESCVSKLIFFS